MLDVMNQELLNIFIPGNVVIYSWIEWIRDFIESHQEEWIKQDQQQLQPLHLEPTTPPSLLPSTPPAQQDLDGFIVLEGCPELYHSKEPLIEKKSVFIAHCCKVTSMKQVKLAQKTLLSNKQISKATHNISAYRIVEAETGIVRQDSNDDGEDAAGNRLLHLLQLSGAQNVYIVVSRWYGGVQLGPMRFKCINNCARLLLAEQGFI